MASVTAPAGAKPIEEVRVPEAAEKTSITKKVANFVKGFFSAIANIFISTFHMMTLNLFKPLTSEERVSRIIDLFKQNPTEADADACREVFNQLTDADQAVIAKKVGAEDQKAEGNIFVRGWNRINHPSQIQWTSTKGFAAITADPTVARPFMAAMLEAQKEIEVPVTKEA